MTALAAALDAVATYRLTRLVTADTITEPAREALIRRAYEMDGRYVDGVRIQEAVGIDPDRPDVWQSTVDVDIDPPALATLITCRWCAGVWIAAGVTAARLLAPGVWDPVARALTASAAAALLANLED